MTKFFGLIASAMVAFSVSSQARADYQVDVAALQASTMLEAKATAGLNWTVGDKASYALKLMGGMIKGTSNNIVREDTGTHYWMVQDMDLMGQKQKAEAMLNKQTGAIEKLLVNGQEQKVPDAGEQEILEMKEANVTVAAGTYDCIYAKIKNKSDGKITEAWINPQAVPMTGMIKAIADSQLGKVEQELTSAEFAKK